MPLYKCVKCDRQYNEGDKGWLWKSTEYVYCCNCRKEDKKLEDDVVELQTVVDDLCKAKAADRTSECVVKINKKVSALEEKLEKVPALEEKLEKASALEENLVKVPELEKKMSALEKKVEVEASKMQETVQGLQEMTVTAVEEMQEGMQKLTDDIDGVKKEVSLKIEKHREETAECIGKIVKHNEETAKHNEETAKHNKETAKNIAKLTQAVGVQGKKEMKKSYNKPNHGNSKAKAPGGDDN